ncbi:hypothetical protein BDF19DRAFT_412819 [Syncephalis fuscata]|nr:hypothetical protein BDF19DRAFT_412819 [Syncephalis fuscata]
MTSAVALNLTSLATFSVDMTTEQHYITLMSDTSSMSGLRSERNMHPLLDDDTVARVVEEFFRRMLASQKASINCTSSPSASEDEDGNESDGPGCPDEAHLHQLLTYFAAIALGEDADHAQSMKRSYYDADHHPITQRFFDCALRHLDGALQSNVPIEVSRRIVGAVKALRHDVINEPLLNK